MEMEKTDEINLSFLKYCQAFPNYNDTTVGRLQPSERSSGCEKNDLIDAVKYLNLNGLSQLLTDWFMYTYLEDMRDNIVTNFWSHFETKNSDEDEAFKNLEMAVTNLNNSIMWYKECAMLIESLGIKMVPMDDIESNQFKGIQETILKHLKGCLLLKIPLHFHKEAIIFYSYAFKAYNSKFNDDQENDDEVLFTCRGCNKVIEECNCQAVLSTVFIVNSNLSGLGLLEALIGDAALTAARYHIEDYVNQNCKGNFDIPYKTILEDWLVKAVFGWLESIFFVTKSEDANVTKTFLNYKELLFYYLTETYATTRMEQLFNIIIEFPESQASLEDLRDCLEKTNLRTKLITSLKLSLETRLLHPGVSTEDILTAYISAIKALRVLDPTGVILQLASQPVCKYLRSREDTVRCIVSSLTDDSNSELMNELMRGAPLVLDDGYGCNSDDDDDAIVTGDWESWMPDPIDADPAKAPKSHRSSDIISILVNIYGTKELFVKEYQTLLADRLLTSFCFDTEREIRYLELLKLRFGESHLHYCEVMLKDVADSKRINSHINSAENIAERNEDFTLDAMIVSAQFWPQLREDRMELPPVIKKAIEHYKKAFEALKGNRTLSWKPSLGLVNLEIELKDRTLCLQVLPIQAGIILHFEEKSQWTIEELSQAMGSSTSVIRRKITLWQSHGVLREEANDTFILVEECQSGEGGGHQSVSLLDGPIMEEEEGDAVTSSTKEQKEEELQMFWSFIVGMLTNLDSLPLEQIHNMLRMFAMQGPNATEWSIHELRQFLSVKVREEKLVYSNGVYKLIQ